MGGAGRLSVPPHRSIIFFNLSIYFSCLTLLIYFFFFGHTKFRFLDSDSQIYHLLTLTYFSNYNFTLQKNIYMEHTTACCFFLPALIYIMSHLRQHYHKIHVERQLELQHQQRFFNRLFSYLTLDCRIHTALSNKMRSKMVC